MKRKDYYLVRDNILGIVIGGFTVIADYELPISISAKTYLQYVENKRKAICREMHLKANCFESWLVDLDTYRNRL